MITQNYLLPCWTLCPLINDDWTGISESEALELDAFIDKESYKYPMFWALCPEDIDNYSGFYPRNDLNNLGDDCITVTFQIGV